MTLTHDLVRRAAAAGFLSAEAIQEMLRRLLLPRVGESLRQIHRRMPDKELTPQIEQEFVEAGRPIGLSDAGDGRDGGSGHR